MRRRVRKIQDTELAATLRCGLDQGSYSVVDAIRVMRVLEGISQEALAKRSGLSKNVIKTIEAGHGNPNITTLENIAAAFDLRIAFVGKDGLLQLFHAPAWSADKRKRRFARTISPIVGPARKPERERSESRRRFELDYVLQRLT